MRISSRQSSPVQFLRLSRRIHKHQNMCYYWVGKVNKFLLSTYLFCVVIYINKSSVLGEVSITVV